MTETESHPFQRTSRWQTRWDIVWGILIAQAIAAVGAIIAVVIFTAIVGDDGTSDACVELYDNYYDAPPGSQNEANAVDALLNAGCPG